MLQTLFHIPSTIPIGPHGVPVFGFGLLLAVWAMASVVLLGWLIWRQGFNGDTRGYVPLLALVGAIIYWVLPRLCDDQGLPIRGYGVMMLAAVVAATALALWRARRAGLGLDPMFNLAFWLFIPGIVAARGFYVIEYWSEQYRPVYERGGLKAALGAVFNVAEGGLVVYGAFIGIVLGLLLFIRKYRWPLLATCDLIAPSMLLGLALGRVGCLLNGCCFGAECAQAWAVTFPQGSPPYMSQVMHGRMLGIVVGGRHLKAEPLLRQVDARSPAGRAGLQAGDRVLSISGRPVATVAEAEAVLRDLFAIQKPVVIEVRGRDPVDLGTMPAPPRSQAVHPTQIYGTINGLLLCLLLLAYDPLQRRDGELFALMISIYPITRFLLERLRDDEALIAQTGMTISQNVSLGMLVFAGALWWYLLRQPRTKGSGFGHESVSGKQ